MQRWQMTKGSARSRMMTTHQPYRSVMEERRRQQRDKQHSLRRHPFDPSSKTITVQYATSNGSAVEPGDYTANSGTLTFVPGDTSETITVSVNGDLISEDNETFNVTLSAPTNASLGDPTGLGTIQNDDNSVLNINDRSIVEGNSGTATLVFTVTLSLENARTVTVQYATANGSASAPGDYEAASGTLTFVPGDLQETISITVTGDTMDEPNEVFSVNLSSPVYATIGDGNGAGTITDDDDPPTLSIQDGSRSEGDSGAASMVFTVTLSEASGFSVSVDYAEGAPGTATPGVDYTAPSGGTLTFVPGETQKTFTVDVLGDTLDENNETFNLALSNPSNASILDGDAVGTIMDDDTVTHQHRRRGCRGREQRLSDADVHGDAVDCQRPDGDSGLHHHRQQRQRRLRLPGGGRHGHLCASAIPRR